MASRSNKQQGLEHLKNTAEDFPVLQRDEIRDHIQRHRLMTTVEQESRYKV